MYVDVFIFSIIRRIVFDRGTMCIATSIHELFSISAKNSKPPVNFSRKLATAVSLFQKLVMGYIDSGDSEWVV